MMARSLLALRNSLAILCSFQPGKDELGRWLYGSSTPTLHGFLPHFGILENRVQVIARFDGQDFQISYLIFC